MSDVSIKRVEEFDSPNGGGFCLARASLGVTSFGMQVENFSPHFEHFPEHDHLADGQEEVYTALSGSATLRAGGQRTGSSPACSLASALGSSARSRQLMNGSGCSRSEVFPGRRTPLRRSPSRAHRSPAERDVGLGGCANPRRDRRVLACGRDSGAGVGECEQHVVLNRASCECDPASPGVLHPRNRGSAGD